MKTLKTYLTLLILFFSIAQTLISCSDSETKQTSTTLTAKVDSEELTKLIDDFAAIVLTTQYSQMKSLHEEFAMKLKVADFDFMSGDRADFATWLGNNLARTDFTSVEDGLDLYDATSSQVEDFVDYYADFYERLENCDLDDLKAIFAPAISIAPTGIGPCLDACEMTCDGQFFDNWGVLIYGQQMYNESGNIWWLINSQKAFRELDFASNMEYIECAGNCV
jgi:hypothetical protein